MKKRLLTLAIGLVAGLAHAQPQAVVDTGFTPWTDAGPIGAAAYADGDLHWLQESTGTWGDQVVQSWLLVWAPVSAASVAGQVDFGHNIVAVLDSRAELQASSALGRPDLVYDFSHPAVGLEARDLRHTTFADSVLSLDWVAVNPGDHVRVLTAVPEPATWLMFAAGLIGIGWLRGHRQT